MLSILHPKNLGTYLLLSAVLISGSYYLVRTQDQPTTISVKGVASKEVTADLATWTFDLTSRDVDRATSYEKLLEIEKTFRAFIQEQGVKGLDIGVGSYDVAPNYVYVDGVSTEEVSSYTASRSFTLTSSDVLGLSDAKSASTAFIVAEGIEIKYDRISYIYTDLESDKITLLENAVENARERADALTENSEVGKLTSASQGIFQVNRKDDYSVSDYGNFDTSSVEKVIRATVTVGFEVR